MPIDNPYTAHIVANALLDARRHAARCAPQQDEALHAQDSRHTLPRLRRVLRGRR